jgi:hypothetical protein
MRPATDLLLAVGREPLPLPNVTNIANNQPLGAFGLGVIGDRPCDLMLNITPLAIVPRQQEALAPLQPLP